MRSDGAGWDDGKASGVKVAVVAVVVVVVTLVTVGETAAAVTVAKSMSELFET